MAVDIIVEGFDQTPRQLAAGGSCANVLAILSMLGWDSLPIGRLGHDAAANLLIEDLKSAGVHTEGLTLQEGVSTPMIVHRFGLGDRDDPRHRFEWTCPVCGSYLPRFRPTPRRQLDDQAQRLNNPEIFYFDRANAGSLHLASQAKEQGSIVFFEPPRMTASDAHFQRALQVSDILKVSCDQRNPWDDEPDISQIPMVIVSHGSEGVTYQLNGLMGLQQGWTSRRSMRTKRVVDTCGSGDWLSAGFIHALFGISLVPDDLLQRIDSALAFGQALAALNCQLAGARSLMRTFSRDEILERAILVVANQQADFDEPFGMSPWSIQSRDGCVCAVPQESR